MQVVKSDLLWAQLMKQFDIAKNEIVEISNSEYDDISQHLSPQETVVNGPAPKLLKCINYKEIITFKKSNSIILKSCIFLIYDDNSYEDVTTKCNFKLKVDNGTLERNNIFENNEVELLYKHNTFNNEAITIEAEYKNLKCNVISYLMRKGDFWYVGVNEPDDDNIEIVNYHSSASGWRKLEMSLSSYDADTPIYDDTEGIEISETLSPVDYYLLLPDGCYIKDAFGRIDSGTFIKSMIIQDKLYNLYKRNGLEYSFPIYREVD